MNLRAVEENPLDCVVPEDEVLGVTLVRTGSDVDKPIALGAMLIGVGGIFVATSKKRRNNES